MGRISRTLFLLFILPILLGGCGFLAKKRASKTKADEEVGKKDVYIGSVELVNPEQGFVLIRTGTKLSLQTGWKLETRPVSGTRSVLTVSPEQKLNFLTADITEGFPQKGDIVVLPPQASATAPAQAQESALLPVPDAAAAALPPPIP